MKFTASATGTCSSSDRKSTRLNSSHMSISYAVFCLQKKMVQPTTVHLDGTPHKTRWRLIMGLMIPLMAGLTPDDFDVFFFDGYGDHRDLHSFPTRRSSDPGLCARRRQRYRGLPADALVHRADAAGRDRKSTRLNSSHMSISYAVFCLKK